MKTAMLFTTFTEYQNIITPHMQHERGKVIGVGVCVYVCGQKKLNHTLAIDSLFQTFAVRLLVKFIDKLYRCFLQKSFPH